MSDEPTKPAPDKPHGPRDRGGPPHREGRPRPSAPPERSDDAAPAAAPPKPMPEPRQPPGPEGKTYFWGTGRRKTSVARVRVRPGQGEFKINGRDINDYFHVDKDRLAIVQPLDAAGARKRVDVFVNVRGGGTTGQAGAIILGVARALKECNPDYEPMLREGHFLTRDARKVERKKYGQRGARRRFQFSKR